jgi:hypothetical protein
MSNTNTMRPCRLVPVDAHLRAQMSEGTVPSPTGLHPAAATRYATALTSTAYGRAHLRALASVDDNGRVLASVLLRVTPAVVHGVPTTICIAHDLTEHQDAGGHVESLVAGVVDQAAVVAPEASLLLVPAPPSTVLAGFVALPTEDVTLTVRECPRRGAPMVPVRSGHHDDLVHIAEFPALGDPAAGLRLERSAAALEFAITRHRLLAGLAPDGARQLRFLVVEEGMRAAAYVVITETAGQWTLEECGDRDPTGARVGAILQMLIALEPAEQRPTITAWLPPGFLPPQLTVTATRPSAVRLFVHALGTSPGLDALRTQDISYWHGDA